MLLKKLIKLKERYYDLLTIEDLKKNQSKIHYISQKDKKNVKILFLDDEGYDIELLKNLDYLDVHKMYKSRSWISREKNST